jgi:predicted enzyme related to lactoylglutathione lyase
LVCGLLITPWALAGHQAAKGDGALTGGQTGSDTKSVAKEGPKEKAMQIFYLEIVTKEVDAVCAAYAAANRVQFGKPDAVFGNARTAAMPGGGLVGVRAPLRDTEEPVVRPYWLVDDIKAALATAEKSGGKVAHPPMEIPGHGTFAIYILGGNDHGLWQR